MGFRLHLRWGLSTQPLFSFRSSSSSCPSLSSLKGRETLYDSVGTSPSFLHWENEVSHSDPFRVRTCLSDRQLQEYEISVTAEMEIGIGSHSSLYNVAGNNMEVFIEEDELNFLKSSKAKQFSLLMQNLDLLENIFTDSCMVGLEREILAQLDRLGALELFNTYLSRMEKSFPFHDLTDTPTELVHETEENDLNIHMNKIVVTSGKKQERELRRRKRSNTNSDVFTVHLQPKKFKLDSRYRNISSGKTTGNFRNVREKIASSEAEMSMGVKVVAELENIRKILEEETGSVASFSIWAEAAGLSQKVLQQRLHYGWHCRDELLRSTRSLIAYLARNYRGLGVSFEDLVQAGSFGVLQGAVRFDHTRGYKFSTYVQYWIKKSMSMLVALHARGIRVPITIIKVINKIQKAKKALRSRHGNKFPSETEIAKFTGLSINRIVLASKCLRVVGSIDQKLGDFTSSKFMECTPDKSVISPEEAVMRQHKINNIFSLLNSLDPKERDILVLRFGIINNQRKSLEEIGRIYGVSKEWIRRVESRALTKLRNKNSHQDLRYYLHL